MCDSRFSGRSIELILPVESIRAIYCRDSGQGLAFDDEDMMADDAAFSPERGEESQDSKASGNAPATRRDDDSSEKTDAPLGLVFQGVWPSPRLGRYRLPVDNRKP